MIMTYVCYLEYKTSGSFVLKQAVVWGRQQSTSFKDNHEFAIEKSASSTYVDDHLLNLKGSLNS